MIDPYYEAHPEDAKKDKALLNLFDDDANDDNEDGEEAVFVDRGSEETPAEQPHSTIPKQYSTKDIKQIRKQRDNADDDTI